MISKGFQIFVLGAVGLWGLSCGQLRTRDEPVVNVPTESSEMGELKEIYDAYKDAVSNPRLGSLPGGPVRGEEGNPHDLGGVARRLKKHAPILGWIPRHGDVTPEMLEEKIQADYPEARPLAVKVLTAAFFWFDAAEAQGNGNGRLDRNEAMTPGLVFGVFANAPGGEPTEGEAGRWGELLRIKVLKQKLPVLDGSMNPLSWNETEERLEKARFGLRFAFHLVTPFTPKGDPRFWNAYDSKITGGNENDRLDDYEAFNAVSDLQFADALRKRPRTPALLAFLSEMYPRVGRHLFGTNAPNPFFWEAGGGDKRNNGQLTHALNRVQLVEQIFREYDANESSRLEPSELKRLYDDIGVPRPKGLDRIVVGIGQRAPGFIKSRLFPEVDLLNTDRTLMPHELYTRLEKLEVAH